MLPNAPRKCCVHAVEDTHWTLVDPDKLEERRDRASDVTAIAGTQNHYHYRFLVDNKVDIRWLSCPCDACFSKQWASCFNKEWIGEFTLIQMHQLDKRGVGQHNKSCKDKSDKIADSLKLGDAVAVFTKEDPAKYWLGKVTNSVGCDDLAPTLTADVDCPVSGEGFEAGERVVHVTYYDRLPRVHNSRLFQLKESLGVFTVPANMLRCKLKFGRQSTRSSPRPIPNDQVVWEVSVEQEQTIMFANEHEFKDADAHV